MQVLYVDPSADANGVGTIASPFNRVNSAFSIAVHPFTILVKRGTYIRNDDYINDTTSKLKNFTGTMSFFGAYGDPVISGLNKSSNRPRWPMNGIWNPQIQSNECCWLVIQNFNMDNQTRVLNTGLGTSNIMLNITSDANDIANVHVLDCGFFGDPRSNTMQAGGNQRIRLFVNSTEKKAAHKITIQRNLFDHVGSGGYIRGNTLTDDPLTNVGDAYRSYGAVMRGNEYVGVVNCGGLLHTCASKTSWTDTTDEFWSGFDDNYYSSNRWDKNGSDAAFWMWHCNKVGGQGLYVDGMQAMKRDGMAFDIDGMCWDCGFRYCYTQNNVSTMMLVSGGAAGPTAWDPATYSYKEWYYNRRMGSGNNVFEYIFSFNDAIQRLKNVPAGTDSSSEIHASHLRNAKCQFNNVVRYCTFIDTVSVKRKLLINSNVYNTGDDTIPALIMHSNLLYCRNLTDTNIMNHVKYTNDTVSNYQDIAPPVQMPVKNSLLFSLGWAAGATPDLSKFASTANKFVDPMFVNLGNSAPSGFDAAKMVAFIKGSSPIFGGGIQAAASFPDINGKAGNNIGWLH
jgi:hypothetical protein